MNDFEIYEKAAKYDMLVNYLFSKTDLAWDCKQIMIDAYDFSNIMEIMEPDRYVCNLENLKESEKEKEE